MMLSQFLLLKVCGYQNLYFSNQSFPEFYWLNNCKDFMNTVPLRLVPLKCILNVSVIKKLHSTSYLSWTRNTCDDGFGTCLLKWVTKIQQAPYKPMEHHPSIRILLIIKLNTVLKAMLILLSQFLSFKTGRLNTSV